MVKKGDVVVTDDVLRVSAETQWEDDYTDGFIAEIPKGTKLEVLYTPAAITKGFECRPIEVNGMKTPEEIENFFVPEHIRNKEGYKSFSFTLKTDDLGSILKKVD